MTTDGKGDLKDGRPALRNYNHNYEIFYVSYIFYFNNFDREGPRGADVYILLNVATEYSRHYAKNNLYSRWFNCSHVIVT